MASSECGNPDEAEVPLEEADVYKATSNSDFVVVRRVRLFRSKFITFHNFEENVDDNKQWILTSQCDLVPRSAADIREPSIKFVRPRGQWAITTLVKPKSIGTRGQPVRLYMFTLSWPTRWAAKGYTSFAFGFEHAEDARHWHTRLSDCLEAIRADKAAAAAVAPTSGGMGAAMHSRVSHGGGVGAAASYGRNSSSAAPTPQPTAPVSASSVMGLPRMGSLGRKQAAGEGRTASQVEAAAPHQVAGLTSASSSPEEHPKRVSASGTAKRALVYDANGATGADVGGLPPSSQPQPQPQLQEQQQPSTTIRNSSFAVASASAAVAAGQVAPPQPQSAHKVQARSSLPPPSGPTVLVPKASQSVTSLPKPPPPPPPSSSDSEGPYEDLDDSIMGGPSGSLISGGGATCRQPRGTYRGDVYHTKQRWVPYKQVNGVAIYHRPQTAGDAEAGVGGEFMVSTVVRGSPRRCLTGLTSNCGNTTILGPALLQEVLQRRQAVDEKEVLRIVVQAPGLAGVICAPRELIVETVLKTDETGPTLVLMFNSCEVPARFVERRPGEQQQPGQQGPAGPSDDAECAFQGGRRSWWRRPVCARVRGGYTMAPLEEYSLDNSPEALVTCIIKVDLGGACGERSWLRLASDLVGWTDAFLDRMLMAVTLLRDEVEQGRFVVQPLSMMASSSRAKDHRDRDVGGSAADLPSMGLGSGASRSVDSNALAVAVGGAAAAGVRHTLRLGSQAARAAAVCRARSRKEADGPSVADEGPADVAVASGGSGGGAGAGGSCAVDGVGRLVEAAEAPEGRGVQGREAAGAGPGAVECEAGVRAEDAASAATEADPRVGALPHKYETMEEVLARMRSLSLLDTSVWDNLHQPGKDAPFKIRGPTYLKDRKKIPAGYSRFVLGSMDVIQQPPGAMHEHVARFIPAIRQSGAPFSVVVHLVIPGTPLLGIVATFVSDRHPATLGSPPAQPMEDDHDWEPFDFVLHKYMTGSTHVRNHCLKLIPHIADGSWMIKQSVGTTPVILGKQLRTIYYETPQYIEIDIDISANNVASYVTGLVRGATRSLVIDMGFVLEGTTPWELPEALLGTLRLYNLDIRTAKLIDVRQEIPLRQPNVAAPPPLPSPRGVLPPRAASPSLRSLATTSAVAVVAASAAAVGAGSSPGGAASLGKVNTSGVGVAGAANDNGNCGAAAAAAAAAAAGLTPPSFGGGGGGGGRLTGIGGSVGAGAVKNVGAGLIGMESAPATSASASASASASESPNGSTSSRAPSARQTQLPAQQLESVSTSGVKYVDAAAAATATATVAATATAAEDRPTPSRS